MKGHFISLKFTNRFFILCEYIQHLLFKKDNLLQKNSCFYLNSSCVNVNDFFQLKKKYALHAKYN